MRFPLLFAAQALAALVFGAEAAVPPDLAELQRRIATSAPAERPALLIELADRFEPVDPLRGIAPAREAIERATSPREKLAAEAVLASLLRQQTDYKTSLELARAGLERATALHDDRLRASFCYDLARTSWNLAEHAEALKYFHEAIRLGEQLGDARVLADAHLGAYIIWGEFEEREQALAHLEAGGKFAEQVGDPQRLADYYRALGNYRVSVRDLAGGRAAHERSRDISARAGHTLGFATALHNLSYISEREGQLDAARTLILEALALYERLGLKRYLANACRQLGGVLVKQRQYPAALAQFERSLTLARGFGGRAAIANSYRDLAHAHEAAGNLPMALEYQHKLDPEREAIFGEKSRQKLALLQARFEAERSQHQLELLRRDQSLKDAELRGVRLQRYGLLAVVILGAIAAAAIVSRQRMKFAGERRVHEETRLARQAAEEANRLKTRLLSIASHDLRSPLCAMIAGARAMELQPHDATLAAELSGGLQREGERLLALVGDLLDLSALETGRLSLARAPCDLAAMVGERIAAHRAAAAAKRQVLTCAPPPPRPVRVSADAGRLAQVLDNLISNAVKFTPPGQPIHVSVEAVDGRAIARVRDAGPGLPPADFARLFQPFQTLSAQPTGGEVSSGLGLFIAREIMTLHDGRLGVDSAPGEGATFFIELPLCPEAGDQKPEARAQKTGNSDQTSEFAV